MLDKHSFPDLVALLRSRNAYFYHACQYQDLESYLELGGIPSRHLLSQANLPFTAFVSDGSDQDTGVWDKVFGNLEDYGWRFARGWNWTPCTYGPILIRMRPACLGAAEDIAICLRSASAAGLDRQRDSLSSIDEVEKLFKNPVGHSFAADIKGAEELRVAFPDLAGVQSPEVSISIPGELLPLSYASAIIVDPYFVGRGSWLRAVVEDSVRGADFTTLVDSRQGKPERLRLYRELGDVLCNSIPPLSQLRADAELSVELREWARTVMEANLEWQYQRYARYLRDGTLVPLATI